MQISKKNYISKKKELGDIIMNINKVKAYIICLIFASLPIVNVGGAVHNSGVMYNIESR